MGKSKKCDKIDDAFYSSNFEKVSQLVEKNDSKKALFYKAIMAEYGIHPVDKKIDLEKAKVLYRQSFGEEQLQAGVNLANIYLKEGKIEDAKAIFKKITGFGSAQDSKNSQNKFKIYAEHTLDSLDAKDIIQNNLPNNPDTLKKAQILSAKLADYLSNLKKPSFLYFEAQYNKARLDLWIAEIEISSTKDSLETKKLNKIKEFIKNNEHRTGDISGLVAKYTHKLDQEIEKAAKNNDKLNSVKQLLTAMSNDSSAKDFSYKAQSLLKSLEIKQKIKQKDYDAAISQCNDVLRSDPTNNEIKIFKFLALSYAMDQRNVADDENLDQAMKLVREVKQSEPSNNAAIRLEAEMHRRLVRKIASEIIENLKEKSRYFDSKFNKAWLGRLGYQDNTKETREFFIDLLSPLITANLEKADYAKNGLLFRDIKNASKELSERIWSDIAASLENNLDNIRNCLTQEKKETKEEKDKPTPTSKLLDDMKLHSKIATPILAWNAAHSNIVANNSGDTSKKYNKFKTSLSKKLEDYYIRCRALTMPDGDLEAKVQSNFTGIVDLTSKVTPIVGAVAGDARVAAFGVVLKTFSDLSIEGKKAALYRSAQEFCKIAENLSDASKQFDYIAETIVKEYGMQIDNIAVEDIEKLANVAAEKMLDKFRNASITGEFVKAFENVGETAVTFLKTRFSIKSTMAASPEKILLEGIRAGKVKEPQVIRTEEERYGDDQWFAHEVFDKPIVTSDGENFYCEPGQKNESNKYGARFISDCSQYVKKDLSKKDCAEFAKSFKKHITLVDSAAWISNAGKQENQHNDSKITSEDLAKKERQLKLKRLVGIVVMLTGVGVMICAGIAATAVAAGVFSATASYGVAAGTMLGLGGFIKGFTKVSVTSEHLYVLSKQKHPISVEMAAERIRTQEYQQRRESFQGQYNKLDVQANIVSPEVNEKWKNTGKESVKTIG